MNNQYPKTMSPNSRSPLTSRIRASLDGKRTKPSNFDIRSPTYTNGFVTQDPESLRIAIDQAINSDAFQNAIAANLARLIKPSIKTALDTIQPLVETVYAHEFLLKKTNQSVENILLRLDTVPEEEPAGPADLDGEGEEPQLAPQNVDHFKQLLEESEARTVAKLSELSSLVQASNGKITEVADSIASFQAEMGLSNQSLGSLKSFTEQSTTTNAVIQAQLDQLKADISLVIDAIGSDLGKNVKAIDDKVAMQDTSLLSSHTTKLDIIATDVATFKGHSEKLEKIQAISAGVEALKGAVEGGISSSNENFSTLGSQISTVLTGVEGHASALEEIRGTDSSPEILAALKKSNDSHSSHAIALGEIKGKALTSGSEPATAPAAESSFESATALQALSADLASLKENIEAGLTSNNEDLTGLGSKIDNVLSTIEGQKAADQSADILAAIQKSNDSHASHVEALEGIRSLNATALATALVDNSNIETQIGSIITTLCSHTSALDEIKAASTISGSVAAPPTTEGSNLQALETNINTIIKTLESHTDLLNEIKDDVSAEILTALHWIGESQATHSTALAEIREADVSDEILTALHSSYDSHASHSTALDEIHAAVNASNDSHAAHAASLDEIKALRQDAGQPTPATGISELGALETQIGAIASTLEDQNATLATIKDAANTSNHAHSAYAVVLAEIENATVASRDFHNSHTSTLAEIKDATATLNESHTSYTATLAEIKDATTALNDSQTSHAVTLAEIKDSTAASNKSHTFHTATLAELKDATTALNKSHASYTTTLVEIKDKTTALNDSQTSHAATLTEIKDATAASNESHTFHTATLAELKDTTTALNESHASHTATLAEIKDYTTALNDSQTSHAAALAEIKGATTASNESHTSHTATLAELKDATTALNDSQTSHAAALAKMKGATTVSNESHTSHTASLAELKDAIKASNEAHTSHTATLADIKFIQSTGVSQSTESETSKPAVLETHLSTIITTLESQSSTLSEIKDATANHEVLTTVKESHSLLTDNHTLLAAHTSLLDAIKESSSHDEILANISSLNTIVEESKQGVDAHGALIKDLHSSTQDSHSSLRTAIETLAVSSAAGASAGLLASKSEDNSSAEILEEVKAIHAIVEKSYTSLDSVVENVVSLANQVQINHTTVTTSVTTLSDELKAEIDASGTEVSTAITVLSENVKGIDISSLSKGISETGKEVKGLKEMAGALSGHVEGTALQIEQLLDGVHFNERGLGQLKGHVLSSGRHTPMGEAEWFKKAAPKLIDKPEREALVPAEDKVEHSGQIQLMSPIREESPSQDMSPMQEESPVYDETPLYEEAAVPEAESVEDQVPAAQEETPAEEETALAREEPALEEAPVPEPEAVEEKEIAPEAESIQEEAPMPEPETELIQEEAAMPEPETELIQEEAAMPEPEAVEERAISPEAELIQEEAAVPEPEAVEEKEIVPEADEALIPQGEAHVQEEVEPALEEPTKIHEEAALSHEPQPVIESEQVAEAEGAKELEPQSEVEPEPEVHASHPHGGEDESKPASVPEHEESPEEISKEAEHEPEHEAEPEITLEAAASYSHEKEDESKPTPAPEQEETPGYISKEAESPGPPSADHSPTTVPLLPASDYTQEKEDDVILPPPHPQSVAEPELSPIATPDISKLELEPEPEEAAEGESTPETESTTAIASTLSP
jgi:chromosome segregation ATPase